MTSPALHGRWRARPSPRRRVERAGNARRRKRLQPRLVRNYSVGHNSLALRNDMAVNDEVLNNIHKAFINFALRGEKADNSLLVDTFVDSAPLLDLMASGNSQIIYGRRGNGKTHAMKYIADTVTRRGDVAIYIDLGSIGSNTSIYNDTSRSFSERAAQLINDVLEAILSSLYPVAVGALDTIPHPGEITSRLDDFQNSLSSVRVSGTVENESTIDTEASRKANAALNLAAKEGPSANIGVELAFNQSSTVRAKTTGREIIHTDFGNIQVALGGLLTVIGVKNFGCL
jgi:hypothetical protein